MPNDLVRPVRDLGGRPQEHGRIRFGKKVPTKPGKADRPVALKHWRFTSADKEAIEALADLYGGTPEEWFEPKANPQHQYQVLTTSAAINVMLPPEALSVWYELWSGKGCERRCDGEEVQVLTSDPNDPLRMIPCKCKQQGYMECKPKSRLNVLLPEIRMAGFWRMETNSWNAVEELSAMENALSVMQQRGILVARLALHEQTDLDKNQKRRHYVVPRLEFNESTAELLAGASQAVGLPTGGHVPGVTGPSAALGLPSGDDGWIDQALTEGAIPTAPPVAVSNPDDEIIEAEIVDDYVADADADDLAGTITEWVPPGSSLPPVPEGPPPRRRTESHAPMRARMHATIAEVAKREDIPADDLRHGMVRAVTSGASESSNDLSDEQVSKIIDLLDEVLAGERIVQMRSGEVRYPRKPT